METKQTVTAHKEVCHHCGGILRYYRGSVSCLMCGRDKEHHCATCAEKNDALMRTA